MTRDDFNMYFSGSFVKNRQGKLCFIAQASGSRVMYHEYQDKQSSRERTCPLSDVENVLDLRAFNLKPFSKGGWVYSPSFRACRGYKDGISDNRVEYTEVGRTPNNHNSSVDRAVAMFYEPVYSNAEGIRRIISGEDTYAAIEDDFVLLKQVNEDKPDPEPLQSISGSMDDNDTLILEDTDTGDEYVMSGNLRMVAMNPELPEKIRQLFNRLQVHTGWEAGRVPQVMQNKYLQWVSRQNKQDVPKIELYRTGMKVCSLLDEDLPPFMKGLKRLGQLKEDLKNEYIRQTTGA